VAEGERLYTRTGDLHLDVHLVAENVPTHQILLQTMDLLPDGYRPWISYHSRSDLLKPSISLVFDVSSFFKRND